MSKVVFVGNVPYNMGEDQLIDAFKRVGQVVGFRLVFDRDSGKPKGYGFCEFADHDTALSAVRNLNGQEIGGRPLRIDLADSDPFLEGKTTIRGELIDSGETRAQWRERERDRERDDPRGGSGGRGAKTDPKAFLSGLPPGVPVPQGSSVLDAISRTLATTDPGQILEVLAQMKAFVITHPDQARALLVAHPQLGYALFQALLLNKIVDPTILQRMLASTTGAPAPGAVPPPQQLPPPAAYPPPVHHAQPPYGAPSMPPMPPPPVAPTPPMYSHAPPMPHMMNPTPVQPPPYYRAPPPPAPVPAPAQPPPGPAPLSQPQGGPNFDPVSRDLLAQVLSLTPEQVNSLPPMERDQIQHLRNQFRVPQ